MNKRSLTRKFLGKIIALTVKALSLTLKFEIINPSHLDFNTPYIYAVWHGQQFIPLILLKKLIKTPRGAMVSTSKDGDILASCLESLKYEVVRGSSSKQSVKALLKMIALVNQGRSMGFAIDGPKGPRGNIKPGIIYLAQKTGKQIVPVSCKINKKYVFAKAWDKFEIPFPWQKVVFEVGHPIAIPANLSKEQIPAMIALLAKKMGDC